MSKEQPLFTVATITYNSGKWVKQAIESILASSFTDFEFLISDDCSTDDTWSIIQQYNDPRIRSWRNEKNTGEYPNRNKVLEEAKGRYILYVDGDDILYRDSLRNLAEYIRYFPSAGMIWGLNPQHFPFFVFPYLVQPELNIKLIYCTSIPISTLGFGEILFQTEVLRKAGGLSVQYKIGDTYIKKKLALSVPVLFVNIGIMFWRQSPQQASKQLGKGLQTFFERIAIDDELLNSHLLPVSEYDKQIIFRNLRISAVKIFFSATIMKGRFAVFFKNRKRLNFKLADLKLLFQKGNYSYSPSSKLEEPLINDYHFTKSIS